MAIEERTLQRIEALLQQATQLSRGNALGQVLSEEHRQQCAGWIASATNIIQLLCLQPTSPYRANAEKIVARGIHLCAQDQVGEVASILTDAKQGLITSIADHARAEIFDDFLDHAIAYSKQNRKSEAGVIAGVVFEDSLRRICRKHEIDDKDVSLDSLISELTKRGILSATKAKRARAAAHVRTKETHAQWDKFDIKNGMNSTSKMWNPVLSFHRKSSPMNLMVKQSGADHDILS
ncbi:MAG: hypothetical protein FD173_416 [Gallionellaceae bacterium]|nr:MAG: hypothetical protein FD173_416 [Gallionellaceae bacterium]